MNAEATTTGNKGRASMQRRSCARDTRSFGAGIAIVACLALTAACSRVGTSVGRVWQDTSRPEHSVGKTLVLVLFPHAEFAVPLEDEWTRQLHDRGIEADAVNVLLPGEHAPGKARVVELLASGGFDTLLVSRLIEVKKIERDAPATQVATVETKLYDARSEEPFWSVRSDTFVGSALSEGVQQAKSEQLREYVETIIAEMVKSKLL